MNIVAYATLLLNSCMVHLLKGSYQYIDLSFLIVKCSSTNPSAKPTMVGATADMVCCTAWMNHGPRVL
ncbi:hypothetical protein SAMN05720781_2191 [Fibrobacter sp. UWT3]|nr:hypothetical protein SAMN05720781_2191 [Fibrobacter sp. UWT3]